MPPSGPKSACSVSPFCANTTRVNEPASTIWPGSSAWPCGPILLASQATPSAGWPSTPAAKPGLFDLGIAVHDAADPAQVDIHRSDRPTAKRDAGSGTVVGDGVDNSALILDAGVDDLDRRHHVFGGAQHVGQADAGTLQALAHDESKFDLDARLAEIGVVHLGAVGDHLVVEDVAVIRLVDHRRALHGLGGQTDFVADQLGARLDLALGDNGGDRVEVLDGDRRKGDVQLHRLFARFLRGDQDIRGLVAVSLGKHRLAPPPFVTVML